MIHVCLIPFLVFSAFKQTRPIAQETQVHHRNTHDDNTPTEDTNQLVSSHTITRLHAAALLCALSIIAAGRVSPGTDGTSSSLSVFQLCGVLRTVTSGAPLYWLVAGPPVPS